MTTKNGGMPANNLRIPLNGFVCLLRIRIGLGADLAGAGEDFGFGFVLGAFSGLSPDLAPHSIQKRKLGGVTLPHLGHTQL